MRSKADRIETLKMIISSQELGNQEEVLRALSVEGFNLTQATLSRDMKQLKVAKAASMDGKYVYVLPNETMYRRVAKPSTAREMLSTPGFISISFSGNMAVVKTRPGYASSIAYNIDNDEIPEILGTIAGDDTIFIVTSDHGGINKGHGGKTWEEMETPLIVAGKGIRTGGVQLTESIVQYDVAATMAYILRLKQPQAWVGRPIMSLFK